MIGQLNPGSRRALIVGGGIAGLLAAYRLDQAGYEVMLHEASSRVGGIIETRSTPFGIAEAGPHSILASRAVAKLFSELEIALTPVRSDSKARFIYRDGKMRRFPLNTAEVALLARLSVFPKRSHLLESLNFREWAIRNLGSAAADYLVDPFLIGIFGRPAQDLSVRAIYPGLLKSSSMAAQIVSSSLSSLKKPSHGRSRIHAPVLGMGALVSALQSRLRDRLGPRFVLNSRVEALPDFENTILAIPASAAAQILCQQAPELGMALSKVEYTPLTSVTVYIKSKGTDHLKRGIGILFPSCEKRPLLGILFNSFAFESRTADPSIESMTVLLRGIGLNVSDIIRAELQSTLKISPDDLLHFEIFEWPRAIPRYDTVLENAWSVARSSWCNRPGRILFGNYTGRVSIRGMVESINLL